MQYLLSFGEENLNGKVVHPFFISLMHEVCFTASDLEMKSRTSIARIGELRFQDLNQKTLPPQTFWSSPRVDQACPTHLAPWAEPGPWGCLWARQRTSGGGTAARWYSFRPRGVNAAIALSSSPLLITLTPATNFSPQWQLKTLNLVVDKGIKDKRCSPSG